MTWRPASSAALLFLALAGALHGSAAADTLYLLGSRGTVVALDPATAVHRPAPGRVRTPDGVVAFAAGLGAQPGTGMVYGLMGIADACTRDPTRTLHADNEDYGCNGLPEADCVRAFAVSSGTPVACAWLGAAGCEACTSPEQGCIDTCAEPPGCAGAPERTRFTGAGAASCAQHDGDATACGEAYFADAAGSSTCYADGAYCRGCDLAAAAAGICTRGCTPPRPCDDPARTLYAGPTYFCGGLGFDTTACGLAFTDSSPFGKAVFSCFATGDGYCQTCTADLETGGYCTNTCQPEPTCAAEPERTLVGGCYEHQGNPGACAASYLRADEGESACFSRPDGTCLPCLEYYEREGECVDVCSPAACTDDPARTTAVAGGDACHAFDGNPAGCAQAFFVGRCGEASCTYETDTATCRPCTVDDPAGCTNACGFDPQPFPNARPALVTFDAGTNQASLIARAPDHVSRPAPTADGVIYVLSEFTTCYTQRALFTIDPATAALHLEGPLPVPAGGALAVNPVDGLLYRLARDEASVWAFATDPLTGMTRQTLVATGDGIPDDPAAMTWSDACSAFVVAGLYGRVLLFDPRAHTLTPTALFSPFEYDEGDLPVGILLDGATCPVLRLPTTTTTSTSTSTTSSTTTSTLPSERLTGARLVLTDDTRRPQKRRLVVRSSDSSIGLGSGPGGADDPTLHGGTVRIFATSGSFDATYPLAADGWHPVGKGGRVAGYKRKGSGPIRTVVLRAGKSLKIMGKGTDLEQPLITDPGNVRVVLRLGGRQWCLEFGGTFDTRTPKRLVARDAPAPDACLLP